MPKKELEFIGYIYDDDGKHSGPRDIYGLRDLAAFITDFVGKDKVVTTVMDDFVLSTSGIYVLECVDSELYDSLRPILRSMQESAVAYFSSVVPF